MSNPIPYGFMQFEDLNSYHPSYLQHTYNMTIDNHLLFHDFYHLSTASIFRKLSQNLFTFLAPFRINFYDAFDEAQRESTSMKLLCEKYNIKSSTKIIPLSVSELVQAALDHSSTNTSLGNDALAAGAHLKKVMTFESFFQEYDSRNSILAAQGNNHESFSEQVQKFFGDTKSVFPIHLIIFHSVFIDKNLIPICNSEGKVVFFIDGTTRERSIISRPISKDGKDIVHSNPFFKKFYSYYMNFFNDVSAKDAAYIQRCLNDRFGIISNIFTAYQEELAIKSANVEFKEFVNPYTWS